MIRVFFLIFEPDVAWDKIAQARRGIAFILGTYLLPFILLVTAAEGWALTTYGKWQPKFERTKIFAQTTAVHFEIVQALLLLATVFVAALLLHIANGTFRSRQSYLQSFTVTAYAFSPMLLSYLLNIGPGVHPAVSWGVGLALTVWVLYQGIPRVLQPDPTHAFGTYLFAVIIITMVSGMVRLFTGMYLLGDINFENSALTHALGHWLGQ